jgi:hypothetical protein
MVWNRLDEWKMDRSKVSDGQSNRKLGFLSSVATIYGPIRTGVDFFQFQLFV